MGEGNSLSKLEMQKSFFNMEISPDQSSLRKKIMTSLVAQTVKNLPAMGETQVGSLGGEDPLEKEMATHSSILVWRSPWTEEFGELQSMGPQRVKHA